MLRKVTDLNTNDFSKGLNTDPNPFSLTKEESPNIMDVNVLRFGSLQKRLGSSTMNSVVITQSGGIKFSNGSQTLSNNLQSYWKLDELIGTRGDSYSTNNLTDINNTPFASGIVGKAASFTASLSNHLIKATTANLETGDINFSLGAWVYLNSTSTTLERMILSKSVTVDKDVSIMLHMNGADASTTFTDETSKTWTVSGDSQIDTAQSKFGGASGLFDGTGDYISTPDHDNFNVGSGDFTIDFWIRFNGALPGSSYPFGQTDSPVTDGFCFCQQSNTDMNFIYTTNGSDQTTIGTGNDSLVSGGNTWQYIAFVRSGSTFTIYVDGVAETTADFTGLTLRNSSRDFVIGKAGDGAGNINGWIDEFRFIKGRALYTAAFTPPTMQSYNDYEYQLFVNTDNLVTFRVSSSGTTHNGSIAATSYGAVTTSTWYNIVAWHDTADAIGISVNLSANSSAYASGVRVSSAPFIIGALSNGALSFDGRIDETAYWKKVLTASERSDLYGGGSGQTVGPAFGLGPWGSFDLGAGTNRWLTVAAGTGLYASSNLGVTWVNIATDRTANYQSFERSKNILVSGSDAYDKPLYWPGSSGTFAAILNASAPLVKYFINFKGFLIGLNSSTRKRGFFWEDENTQLTGDWGDSFDIPSSYDDEITSAFILEKRLFVSTRYKLYNISYVGGNPDWQYDEVKNWGFVPKTVKKVYLDKVGEVACGMDWNKRLRIFDAGDDKIISDKIEYDNGFCDFAMSKISYAGSGISISFAEHDDVNNVYKLCVAIGQDSTNTTHIINFDGRTSSFYPYSNQNFNTMVMAESANRRFLMAFDRKGFVHMIDSGNLDGGATAISEVYESPIIFGKSPSESSKSHKIDLYFKNNTAGRLYIDDRIDFLNSYKFKESFVVNGSDNVNQFVKSLDTPQGQNVYQFRMYSSGGTSDPWMLNRFDFFQETLGVGRNG